MYSDIEGAQEHIEGALNPIQYKYAEKRCKCTLPRLVACFFQDAGVLTNTDGVVIEACLKCGNTWFKKTTGKDLKAGEISVKEMFCTSDGFMFSSPGRAEEHVKLEEQLKLENGVEWIDRYMWQLTRYDGSTPQCSPSCLCIR